MGSRCKILTASECKNKRNKVYVTIKVKSLGQRFLLLLHDNEYSKVNLKHVLVQVTMTERRTFDVRIEMMYGQECMDQPGMVVNPSRGQLINSGNEFTRERRKVCRSGTREHLIVGVGKESRALFGQGDCKGSTHYWNSLKYWEGLTGGRPSVYFPALIGQRDQEPEYSTFPN